ncbi:hypothetical protein D5674_09920 [Enterococcus faecalis]|nr:hypothetical protein [Enterococcus faecalis]HBC2593312.1 hypothetical protein [Enterococcus faecalis]
MDIVQLMENNEPKAMATVVEAVDGLENYPTKAETDKMYQKIPQKAELWSGVGVLNDAQKITPKKKLTDCTNGWLLVWQPYEGSPAAAQPWDYNYSFIPKAHLLHASGNAINCLITNRTQTKQVSKYVYINENEMTGHVANGEAPQNGWVLTKVFEF